MTDTTRNRPAGNDTGTYLREAPPALIALHSRIGSGKEILRRLLTDPQMRGAWRELTRHVQNSNEWENLWVEIVYALKNAKKKPLSRAKQRNTYRRIAADARRLAASIESGPLDLLAFEAFPEEVMQINGVPAWGNLDSLQRSRAGHRLLRAWPSVPELLRELEARAERLASEAMRAPAPVDRTTRDSATIIVVRRLADYFSRKYCQNLYGTVAAIASVALKLNQDVSKRFVENTVRRWRHRGLH